MVWLINFSEVFISIHQYAEYYFLLSGLIYQIIDKAFP